MANELSAETNKAMKKMYRVEGDIPEKLAKLYKSKLGTGVDGNELAVRYFMKRDGLADESKNGIEEDVNASLLQERVAEHWYGNSEDFRNAVNELDRLARIKISRNAKR